MPCNLCHEQTGHKPNCSTLIPVNWNVPRSDSSSWEVLCREIFAEYVNDSIHENDKDWQRTMPVIRQHIEDGNAYDAYRVMRAYRDRSKTDGRK